MNKKGMTLIEVLVSITILSVASLLLFTGFQNVLHFMGKSADVKNASNALLSYVEGTDNEGMPQRIEKAEEQIDVTYSINHKDTQIHVEGVLDVYRTTNVMDTYMKQLLVKKSLLLKEYPSYKSSIIAAENLKKELVKIEKEICESVGSYCDLVGRNNLLKRLFVVVYNSKYSEFNRSLLPKELLDKGTPFYVRTYYPWEEENDNFEINSGGSLIFLSAYNRDYGPQYEKINVVYNDREDIWYYHKGEGATLDEQTPFFRKGEDSNLCLPVENNKVDCQLVKNETDFIQYIKDNKDGKWTYLDGNLPYEGGSIENYWRKVE